MSLNVNSTYTQAQIDAINTRDFNKMKAAGLSDLQIGKILSGSDDSYKDNGLQVEKTTKVQDDSTKVIQSSDDFYKSNENIMQEVTAMKFTYDEPGNYKHSESITNTLQNAVPPEVSEDLVVPKKYDDGSDPTSLQNSRNCALGKDLVKMLANSPDKDVADLAQKAQKGDVDSIRALSTLVSSWQPEMVDNAKKAEDLMNKEKAEGKTDEEARKDAIAAGYLDKYGGPIKDGNKPWVVPAKYLSPENIPDKKNDKDSGPKKSDNPFPTGTHDWDIAEYQGVDAVSMDNHHGTITGLADDNPFFGALGANGVHDGRSARCEETYDGSGVGGYHLVSATTKLGDLVNVSLDKDNKPIKITANSKYDPNGDNVITLQEFADATGQPLPEKYKQYSNMGIPAAKLYEVMHNQETVNFADLLVDTDK